MSSKYTVLRQPSENDEADFKNQFMLDVLMGFSATEKHLSSKYFYDSKGSRLFSQIMDAPEYYPSNCEHQILSSHKKQIAQHLSNQEFNFVELGAGDARKTKTLLKEFVDQGLNFKYLPIDISEEAILQLSELLDKELPDLSYHGVVGEYQEGLQWIHQNTTGTNVIFFLGSNIGNFDRTQAIVFLRTIWNTMNSGEFLFTGFDLKKDIDVLLSAYNDSEGVTRQFNLNVLERINNELGGRFDVSKFQHFGTYNPLKGAMESYLISLEDQDVYIDALAKEFHFKAFESIHMEYSYKYLPSDIDFLAKETGFKIVETFLDDKGYFADSLWQARKLNL